MSLFQTQELPRWLVLVADLRIRVGQQKGATVLEVQGYLTLQHGFILHSAVKEALKSGAKRVVLNFSPITYGDCHGIGQMAACHGSATRMGGKLQIVGIIPKVHLLLEVSDLPGVFSCDRDMPGSLARVGQVDSVE